VAQNTQWRKDSLFNNCCCKNWYPHVKTETRFLSFTLY
jgi:hypothetical protein